MKIFTIALFGILSFALVMAFTNFMFKKLKSEATEEGKTNLSFTVLLTFWLLCSAVLNLISLKVYTEFIDTSYKLNSTTLLIDSLEGGVLLIGSACFWLFSSYYLTKVLSQLVIGSRNDIFEMKANNLNYFILRGVVILVFTISTLPLFEYLIRFVLPTLNIPFYR